MRKADNLPPYCAVVKNSRSLNFLDPSGPAWRVTGVLYLYLLTVFSADVYVSSALCVTRELPRHTHLYRGYRAYLNYI